MPPRFGVSSALACGRGASASAANATKNNRQPGPIEFLPIASACLLAARVYPSRGMVASGHPAAARRRSLPAAGLRSLTRAALLVEPHGRKILVQEVARADLPASD